MCFGVILGWVIGAQQAGIGRQPGPSAGSTSPTAGQGAGNGRQAPPLDEARVQALTAVIKSDPKNAGAVVQLANTYFDAERFGDAITWYERSLAIDPKNADASTDLGISYYYTGQTDRALQQFERSLAINPRHTKTLLNQGIVLAFGKEDLEAAAAAWKQVVALAPDSPEGQAARRAIEGVTAAGHPSGRTTPGS
jgi:tetratricopeptide (TPR) repeat protein